MAVWSANAAGGSGVTGLPAREYGLVTPVDSLAIEGFELTSAAVD